MKTTLLGVLVLGLLVAAEQPPRPDDFKEKLKGTWTIMSVEQDGKKLPDEDVHFQSVTFDGEKVTFKRGDRTINGTYKIDASQKPAHLDFASSDDPDTTMKWIVQLDGETLKFGSAKSERGERPKNFETAVTIITLKREKK